MGKTVTKCFDILTGECKSITELELASGVESPYIFLIPAHYPVYTHDGNYDGIIFEGGYVNKEEIPYKIKEFL